jgi:hypothetical protein
VKIIISHDIDYITFWEHRRNLVIPKFIVRNFIEYFFGYISSAELAARFRSFLKNKWQNTEEMMAFDKENNIPSTFFVAVSGGRDQLSYPLESAKKWIARIRQEGFDVGVHAIAFNDFKAMKEEFEAFSDIVDSDDFGVRIHYVQTEEGTFDLLDRAGYLFDSSVFDVFEDPYKVGGMWEFPLHLMDAYTVINGKRWQNQTLEQAKKTTEQKLEKARRSGLEYFNFLSHDIYFSDGFLTWKNWYIWMIRYFRDRGYQFVSYREAIEELRSKEG